MLRALVYLKDGTFVTEPTLQHLREIIADPANQVWIDIERMNPADTAFLHEDLHIHPVAVEELLFPTEQPQMQSFGDHILLVLHAPSPNLAKGGMDTVEIDFVVGGNFIVTVRSGPIASITRMEEHIRANPKVMARGCDFLLYFIADAMVDDYLPILDALEKRIDVTQEAALKRPTRETFADLIKLKSDILEIRRATVPQLEVLRSLMRGQTNLIEKGLEVYFRAICEHLQQVNQHLGMFREEVNSIIQVCLAVSSNQVNDVVRLFTIIAAVLMPPTVIAGIFGMNFDFPPWLVRHGLWFINTIMGIMTVGIILALRWKRWL